MGDQQGSQPVITIAGRRLGDDDMVDPRIMRPALDALGLEAGRVLYVGDTVHADVVGATNAGMQVVQLDPFDHHVGYAHPRVRDVGHLLELLGRP